MASSAPRGLRSDHVLTVGIALFSMLFGAGNLIIPPLLALQAGSATPVAMLGFLIAAIGLPVMGFIAVALAGTARELAGRVHPKFGEFFVAAVYLAIGRVWPFRVRAPQPSRCWCRCCPRRLAWHRALGLRRRLLRGRICAHAASRRHHARARPHYGPRAHRPYRVGRGRSRGFAAGPCCRAAGSL